MFKIESAEELIEKAVRAAMRAHQLHIASPRDAGVGNGPHLALIAVQSKLVQHATAPLASLGIGVAAHAVDAPAARELQHIGAELLFRVQHHQISIRPHQHCPLLRVKVQDLGDIR